MPEYNLPAAPKLLASILGISIGVRRYIAANTRPYHHCGEKKNDSTINTIVAITSNIPMIAPTFDVKGHVAAKILSITNKIIKVFIVISIWVLLFPLVHIFESFVNL